MFSKHKIQDACTSLLPLRPELYKQIKVWYVQKDAFLFKQSHSNFLAFFLFQSQKVTFDNHS